MPEHFGESIKWHCYSFTMQVVSNSGYMVNLPMHILTLPDLRLRTPYTMLPQPNAIDQWLSKTHINSYTNMGDLPSDHVLCTVQLVTFMVRYWLDKCDAPPDNPSQTDSQNISKYSLMLYVEVPETSSVDIAHLSNPIATLGCYDGHSSDSYALEWTHLTTGIPFDLRQPSYSMTDVFREIAFWPENAGIVCSFHFSNVNGLSYMACSHVYL